MTDVPDILCIGSVLWDMIGRTETAMQQGADVPGRITQLPGGVALNIAMTLRKFGLSPALLSSVGKDREGDELISACTAMGINTSFVYRSEDLPTDRYMAIEGANGLVAAIADARSLEIAGNKILTSLRNGELGSRDAPYPATVALDGNLTRELLETIATDTAFARADLRVAPASPGKAERLQPLLAAGRGVLYVNLDEASILCQRPFDGSDAAARALVSQGAARVLVTDGGRPASDACPAEVLSLNPPQVPIRRVTGAGDTFMAAHIAAEVSGADRAAALSNALDAAAAFVSGDPSL